MPPAPSLTALDVSLNAVSNPPSVGMTVRLIMGGMATRKQEHSAEYARAVSKEIRSQMGDKRVSGVKLAAACNISQNYLSKRLRDELPFTLNDIQHIAKALGMEYSELMFPVTQAFDSARKAETK